MVKGRLDRSSCKAKRLSLAHTDIERNKAVGNYMPKSKKGKSEMSYISSHFYADDIYKRYGW